MSATQLVILDRDGVINEDPEGEYVKSADEWEPIKGSLEAVALLNRAGFRVVVASNQSGLARGLFDIEALNSIHEKMQRMLAEAGGEIDAIFFCPHGPRQRCQCRKPKPGLINEIVARYRVDAADVPVVGDKRSDLDAARAAGARPILVRTGYGEKTLHELGDIEGLTIYTDLAAFADAWIAQHKNP